MADLNVMTSPVLKPMSVTRPKHNRQSSILIFDDKSPSWTGDHFLESQMSLTDLNIEIPLSTAGNV